MNYEFLFPMWKFFGTQNISNKLTIDQFIHAMSECIFSYPKPVLENLFNLIDSHDTERLAFVTHNHEPLIKLMFTFLYMLPGTPSMYYGDEVGLTGVAPWDARSPMEWRESHQNLSLKSFIKNLNHLYQTYPDFKSVDITWHHYDHESIVVIKEELIFIFNHTDKKITLNTETLKGKYLDIFTQEKIELTHTLSLEAYGFLVLNTQ